MRRYRFGCGDRLGHYYWDSDNGQVSSRDGHNVVPWGLEIDNPSLWTKPTNGKVAVHHKDGWTGVGVKDNSVDHRPGSIQVFVFEGNWTDYEAVRLSLKHFPKTVKRLGGVDALTLDYRDWPE